MMKPHIEADTIERLSTQAHMPIAQAHALVEQEGLDSLRLRAGAYLYRTTPLISSGEAAQRVGLENRDLLLRYLIENNIAPAEPSEEDTAALQEQLLHKLDQILPKGWRRQKTSDN